jgi:Animal haem peroxidase/Catalase
MPKKAWVERYEGGSPEAEQRLFEGYARDILRVQLKYKKKAGANAIERASHAKMLLGVANANLRVSPEIPEGFQVGHFQPGKDYAVTIRFSNASGACHPDSLRDLRGAAIRIRISDQQSQDLFVANYPTAHVRNARQFIAFSKALSGSSILFIPRLVLHLGPFRALRTATNLLRATRRSVRSLALESYWSRGPILWGDAGPVRYLLRPAANAPAAPKPASSQGDYLREEMAARLRRGDVAFDLYLQPFVSEWSTPIENFAASWKEKVSRPVLVGTLTLPQQDIDAAEGRAMERRVDQMAFNPWYTTEAFRPLGNMNRARKEAYRASSAQRLGYRFCEEPPRRNVIASRIARVGFAALNRYVPWHRLPQSLALLNLAMLRSELREKNLIDTAPQNAGGTACLAPSRIPEAVRTARTHDGTFNDLSQHAMGSIGSAFGRNMRPVYQPDKFDRPDPILVSRELLTRDTFIPAKSLNVLAAAWIQFQVHDWVNHARYDLGEQGKDIVLPRPGAEPWRNHRNLAAESDMRIAGNKILGHAPSGCPVFPNIATPWWDGSEVYGEDAEKAAKLRAGALLRLDNGYLPTDLSGINVTGFNEAWWLGLSAMHTMFAREHNVICKELQAAYPAWSDERVYQTARLIVAALIAKIHTVEWTPAILATKTVETALRSNWYGAPRDWLTQLGTWLFDAHLLKGIPETRPDHHAAPYSLTEEFVAVYRMHPLIPDDYAFFDHRDGRHLETRTFSDIQGPATDGEMRRLELANVLYSFGIAHPGAITLHNFPRSLQKFERLNGELIDLSVVDIVRDRRRGVPRYNDFRAALRRPRLRDWEELSTSPTTQRKLRDVYGKLNMVDTMIGLFAEAAPSGFGFSDTAFRIFLLMATRRLQSDRFLTVDFRPEVYSPLGIDWIANNGMTSIILRHCPELAAALPRSGSAFAPFRPIASAAPPQSLG